jgi:hypothetical protein
MDITSIFPDVTENKTIKYGHIGHNYKVWKLGWFRIPNMSQICSATFLWEYFDTWYQNMEWDQKQQIQRRYIYFAQSTCFLTLKHKGFLKFIKGKFVIFVFQFICFTNKISAQIESTGGIAEFHTLL